MSLYTDTPAVAIQVSRDIVVASIQVDLSADVLARLRDDLLHCVNQSGSSGVVFDLSGLDTLDSGEFNGLRQIITMCKIMGAESILVGLRPGVVSSLIEAGVDADGLRAAINLDAAYAMLQPEPDKEPDKESEIETGSDDVALADQVSPLLGPAQNSGEPS